MGEFGLELPQNSSDKPKDAGDHPYFNKEYYEASKDSRRWADFFLGSYVGKLWQDKQGDVTAPELWDTFQQFKTDMRENKTVSLEELRRVLNTRMYDVYLELTFDTDRAFFHFQNPTYSEKLIRQQAKRDQMIALVAETHNQYDALRTSLGSPRRPPPSPYQGEL